MTITKYELNRGRIREEAVNLNTLGALNLRWNSELPMTERDKNNRLRCIGYAIDNEERECLLFIGPYGPEGRFVVRSIRARDITEINVLGETAPGGMLFI